MIIKTVQINMFLEYEKSIFIKDVAEKKKEINIGIIRDAVDFAVKYSILDYDDLEAFIDVFNKNSNLFNAMPVWLTEILMWPDITGKDKIEMIDAKILNIQ